MASVTPVVYPIPGYVQLQINVADWNPHPDFACVYRVDDLTGARTQLRPHTAYSGLCQNLSCQATAVMWDTEAPLDRSISYCVQGMTSAGATVTAPVLPYVLDSFSRTVAAGAWGTADTGQLWTVATGTASHYSVNGTRGLIQLTAVADPHRIGIDGNMVDTDAMTEVFPTVVATGSYIEMGIVSRRLETGSGSDVRAMLQFNTNSTVTLVVTRFVAGVATTLGTFTNIGTYTAASSWSVRLRLWGNQVSAKAWDTTMGEPSAFQLTTIDTGMLTGPGLTQARAVLNTGNTNTLPVTVQFDNFQITDPCATAMPLELCTPSVVVPSGGLLRLGDPQNPCADQVLRLATGSPDCLPNAGIFFGSMGGETASNRSESLLPFDSKLPVTQARKRGGVDSTLNLVTRTFADQDALRALAAPGNPLLLRSPAQYGIYDKYIQVGDLGEDKGKRDHRFQARVWSLPFIEVRRPPGPATGVCGTRYDDLCDRYATWQDVVNAGLSYNQLLQGAAGTDMPVPAQRVWNDVNATYADWNAVNAGNSNWTDLLDGP